MKNINTSISTTKKKREINHDGHILMPMIICTKKRQAEHLAIVYQAPSSSMCVKSFRFASYGFDHTHVLPTTTFRGKF